MPPFVYQPYRNPYINSISELMQRQGEIPALAAEKIAAAQADAVRQSAQAQANAQLVSGQAWGGAINNIGQNIAGTIQTLTDPRRKVEALQMQELQGKLQDQQALRSAQSRLDNALAPHALGAGQEGPQAETYLTADGLNDIPKQQEWINSVGLSHFAPELLKGAEDINTYVLNARDHERKAADAKAIMLGYMANGALKMHQLVNIPLDGAIEFVAQPGINQKQITRQDLDQFKAGLAKLPPEQQIAALEQVKARGAELGPKTKLSDKEKEYDMYGDLIVSNKEAKPGTPQPRVVYKTPDGIPHPVIAVETPTGVQYQYAGKDVTADVTIPPTGADKPPASQDVQGVIRGLKGNHWVSYYPSTDPINHPAKWMFTNEDGSQRDVSGIFTPKVDASIIIRGMNDEPIKLPAWALNSKMAYGNEGDIPDPEIEMTPNGLTNDTLNFMATGAYPSSGRGQDRKSRARRTAIESKAGAILANSGMNGLQFRAFAKANASSLMQEQKALDTVQGFMAKADLDADMLEETLKKMPDLGMPIFNKPLRSFEKEVKGNQDLAEILTRLNSVTNEYSRITAGGVNLTQQMTDSSRKDMQQLLSSSATVAQMVRSLRALRSEGDNRLVGLDTQIKNIMRRMTVPSVSGGTAGTDLPPYQVIKK